LHGDAGVAVATATRSGVHSARSGPVTMRPQVGHEDEVRSFTPPSCPNAQLSCQLLVVGGGLSGLSAAEAAVRRGVDVIVIERGAFGREAASGLNAGQFLTGWAKPVETMLAELTL